MATVENDRHFPQPQLFGQHRHVFAVELDIENGDIGLGARCKAFERISDIFVRAQHAVTNIFERMLEIERDDEFVLDDQDVGAVRVWMIGNSVSDSRWPLSSLCCPIRSSNCLAETSSNLLPNRSVVARFRETQSFCRASVDTTPTKKAA